MIQKADPKNEIVISIQKMNIKGMEKFIKDLNEQVSKICHFSAKLESSTSEYFKEYLRQQMLADLKNTKLKIEFTNLETDDMEVLKSKVSPNIEKVYVKEYEKEIKELENANEMKRKTSKGPNASIKNRSSKRRSNMLNSDNKSGWETESLPTQRMDELQRTYEHKIKMYIDRIKEQVIFNDLDLLSEQEKESIYLRREYSKLNDSKEEEVKEEEEEKEISKTYLKHTKHAKILERCSITSQEDLYKCLQNFFVLLHNHKTSPVFSFCLSLFDFLLDNEQNSYYLMTYPNSINFLSLFQKTTCLLSSPTSTSLPGLLFLSEIICRNPDSFLGMPSLSREVLDRLDEFNSDLVGEINVDVKARLAYTLAMVKDVQGDKVATMDMIEK